MPERDVLEPAAVRWTDLSRLEIPGMPIVLEPGAERTLGLREGRSAGATAGRRLFRVVLCADASVVQLLAVGGGCVGRLQAGDAASYDGVLAALGRARRTGVCSGYLVRQGDGRLEARLLLHEPDECLRRIELDCTAGGSRS